MTITYTIPGVPLLDQLHESTSDGQPDENARMNCVFASNAALATAYLHRSFNGDQLKDSDPKYGQGYTGGASEANLVDTMAQLGISVVRVAHPTQQLLIDELHHHIPQGHACIVTMPSQWGTAPANPRTYSGSSHVGLACGVGPGMIRVMNPWGGFWQDESDSWWAARLLAGEVWIGTYVGTGATTVGVPQGWKDDGRTLTAPNGVPVVLGCREYVLNHPWAPENTPLRPEAQLAQIEPGNAAMGKGSRQDFRFGSLGCQQHADGSWGTVYEIAVGQDIVALENQVAELGMELTAAHTGLTNAEAAIASLKQQLATTTGALTTAQAQVNTLTGDNASLKQQLQNAPVALEALATLKSALAQLP